MWGIFIINRCEGKVSLKNHQEVAINQLISSLLVSAAPKIQMNNNVCRVVFQVYPRPAGSRWLGSKVGGPVTMRQAVEAQVLNPHCELGEHGQSGGEMYFTAGPGTTSCFCSNKRSGVGALQACVRS